MSSVSATAKSAGEIMSLQEEDSNFPGGTGSERGGEEHTSAPPGLHLLPTGVSLADHFLCLPCRYNYLHNSA